MRKLVDILEAGFEVVMYITAVLLAVWLVCLLWGIVEGWR